MKKIKIFKFCLLFTSLSLAQSNTWDLEQCVNHALENNITILQAKNTLLSSEQDIISAKGNFLPAISSNISGGASDITLGVMREEVSFSDGPVDAQKQMPYRMHTTPKV